ncbi:Hint domain-containing protein [Thioclava sp. GXIMD2076]|uniref:Hint domain-containing protein n=1 Tax=Thioclava sp. GXIMD2076 TaxID=3131931 RepID=UPI0030CE8A67
MTFSLSGIFYDKNGYDKDGYNKDGYDCDGYNRSGYDKDGYDREGYDCDGYDKNGYDCDGYNRDGRDENGCDKDGHCEPITGTECNDILIGSDSCDDTITGLGGNDLLYGADGDDLLDGGAGRDVLWGGRGNDTLIGSAGDTLNGGSDADSIYVTGDHSGTIYVDGGSRGDDNDTLYYGALLKAGYTLQTEEPCGGWKESGVLKFYNCETKSCITVSYCDIENVVPCFTPGSLIATPTGEIAVERLRAGDKILTRDNGVQEIAWAGQCDLGGEALRRNPDHAPILIQAGALGNGLPERDMCVSPNHRMLLTGKRAQLYFEEYEVLVAAKYLVGMPGVMTMAVPQVSYIHFMCERHEIALVDGAWTESFQPGEVTLSSMGVAQKREIFALFPELANDPTQPNFTAARRSLRRHEATLLFNA